MTNIPQGFLAPFAQQRWVEIVNTEDRVIPPYACLEVAADYLYESTVDESPGGIPRIGVKRPSADNLVNVMFNGPLPIRATSEIAAPFGFGTFNPPAWARYDDGDTPVAGDEWGAQKDSYEIKKGNTGYYVLGNASATDRDGNAIVRLGPPGASGRINELQGQLCNVMQASDFSASVGNLSIPGSTAAAPVVATAENMLNLSGNAGDIIRLKRKGGSTTDWYIDNVERHQVCMVNKVWDSPTGLAYGGVTISAMYAQQPTEGCLIIEYDDSCGSGSGSGSGGSADLSFSIQVSCCGVHENAGSGSCGSGSGGSGSG